MLFRKKLINSSYGFLGLSCKNYYNDKYNVKFKILNTYGVCVHKLLTVKWYSDKYLNVYTLFTLLFNLRRKDKNTNTKFLCLRRIRIYFQKYLLMCRTWKPVYVDVYFLVVTGTYNVNFSIIILYVDLSLFRLTFSLVLLYLGW